MAKKVKEPSDTPSPNITERKQIEERYQDLVEKEKDIIYSLNNKGEITFASPAVETILGYRPEELMETNFMALIPKDGREKQELILIIY